MQKKRKEKTWKKKLSEVFSADSIFMVRTNLLAPPYLNCSLRSCSTLLLTVWPGLQTMHHSGMDLLIGGGHETLDGKANDADKKQSFHAFAKALVGVCQWKCRWASSDLVLGAGTRDIDLHRKTCKILLFSLMRFLNSKLTALSLCMCRKQIQPCKEAILCVRQIWQASLQATTSFIMEHFQCLICPNPHYVFRGRGI